MTLPNLTSTKMWEQYQLHCAKPQQKATKRLPCRQSTNSTPQQVNKSILISHCTIMWYSCRLSAILTHKCKHWIQNLFRESGIGDYPPIRLLSQGLDQRVMTNLFKLRIAWETICVIAKMFAICVCVHVCTQMSSIFRHQTKQLWLLHVISWYLITQQDFLTTIKTYQSKHKLRPKSLFNKCSLKWIINWIWMYIKLYKLRCSVALPTYDSTLRLLSPQGMIKPKRRKAGLNKCEHTAEYRTSQV